MYLSEDQVETVRYALTLAITRLGDKLTSESSAESPVLYRCLVDDIGMLKDLLRQIDPESMALMLDLGL